jgi:integrase
MLNVLYANLATGSETRRPLSAKTISYIHSTLHKVLADAVDAGLLGRNVAASAKPPPAKRAIGGINAWEPHELAQFLGVVWETRLGPIWRLPRRSTVRPGPFDKCLTNARNNKSPGDPGLFVCLDYQDFYE